ncbi:MAG: hypothetical protein KC619_28130 [Myxococcales bacterium]|nr:hypothetical protein [Myxococcales bacterium]
MTVACSKCGAPLEPPPGADSVRCQYCGTLTTIERAAPPPPQVVIVHAPGASFGAPSHDVAAAAVKTSGCGALMSVAIAGFVMLVVGVAVIVPLVSTGVVGSVPGLGWDGSAPLVCSGNGHESASGVTAQMPGEVAVEAGGNCQVELEGVDLDADQVLTVGGNAHVTVRDGTLRTREPIRVDGNGHLELRNTIVISDGPAFELGANGRVDARGGQIQYVGQPYIGRPNRFEARTTQLVPRN